MEHQWRCNMAERETIGLIGLGEMGQPMASRLMQGGWHVIGYDVEDKALDQAVAAGVRQADRRPMWRGPSTGRSSASSGHCRRRRRFYSMLAASSRPSDGPSTWR